MNILTDENGKVLLGENGAFVGNISGGGESYELLYDVTLTDDLTNFSQALPIDYKKAIILLYPKITANVSSGFKQITFFNKTYPVNMQPFNVYSNMPQHCALFTIDRDNYPSVRYDHSIYYNPDSLGTSGYTTTTININPKPTSAIIFGVNTSSLLKEGTIIKIWGSK